MSEYGLRDELSGPLLAKKPYSIKKRSQFIMFLEFTRLLFKIRLVNYSSFIYPILAILISLLFRNYTFTTIQPTIIPFSDNINFPNFESTPYLIGYYYYYINLIPKNNFSTFFSDILKVNIY